VSDSMRISKELIDPLLHSRPIVVIFLMECITDSLQTHLTQPICSKRNIEVALLIVLVDADLLFRCSVLPSARFGNAS